MWLFAHFWVLRFSPAIPCMKARKRHIPRLPAMHFSRSHWSAFLHLSISAVKQKWRPSHLKKHSHRSAPNLPTNCQLKQIPASNRPCKHFDQESYHYYYINHLSSKVVDKDVPNQPHIYSRTVVPKVWVGCWNHTLQGAFPLTGGGGGLQPSEGGRGSCPFCGPPWSCKQCISNWQPHLVFDWKPEVASAWK